MKATHVLRGRGAAPIVPSLPLREDGRSEPNVVHLLIPNGLRARGVRRAFHAVVAAVIGVGAVAVVFPIRAAVPLRPSSGCERPNLIGAGGVLRASGDRLHTEDSPRPSHDPSKVRESNERNASVLAGATRRRSIHGKMRVHVADCLRSVTPRIASCGCVNRSVLQRHPTRRDIIAATQERTGRMLPRDDVVNLNVENGVPRRGCVLRRRSARTSRGNESETQIQRPHVQTPPRPHASRVLVTSP